MPQNQSYAILGACLLFFTMQYFGNEEGKALGDTNGITMFNDEASGGNGFTININGRRREGGSQ